MAEIELKLTGDLGRMIFPDVLATLSNAYDMLVAVQRQVLGPKAEFVAWALRGLRGGSAVAVLHAGPSDDVGAGELESVVLAFGNGAQALMSGADTAPEYFADDALVAYRKLVGRLRDSDVGDLVASAGDISVTVAGVADEPPALRLVDAEFTVEGSVVGQLDAINVHRDKREASLCSDLDKVRVRVVFPRSVAPARA